MDPLRAGALPALAAARGSPKTFSDPAMPWTSCTAWPPDTSTAGNSTSPRLCDVTRRPYRRAARILTVRLCSTKPPTRDQGRSRRGSLATISSYESVDQLRDLVVGDAAVEAEDVPAVCADVGRPGHLAGVPVEPQIGGLPVAALEPDATWAAPSPRKAKILLPTLTTRSPSHGSSRQAPGLPRQYSSQSVGFFPPAMLGDGSEVGRGCGLSPPVIDRTGRRRAPTPASGVRTGADTAPPPRGPRRRAGHERCRDRAPARANSSSARSA